jgi:hypothetical protein
MSDLRLSRLRVEIDVKQREPQKPRQGCQKRWSIHLDVDAPLPTPTPRQMSSKLFRAPAAADYFSRKNLKLRHRSFLGSLAQVS